MKINPNRGISVDYAHGVVSFTSKQVDYTEEFDKAVRDIHSETLRVDPYIPQDGIYEKVPGKGLCSYLLIPPGQTLDYASYGDGVEDREIGMDEMIVQEYNINEEISKYNPEADEPYVVLIDGDSYSRECIESLPTQRNVFTLFSPYNIKRTLPVVEAKRYVQRKTRENRPSNIVIAKVIKR